MRIPPIGPLLCSLLLACGNERPQADVAEIRATFDGYVQAVSSGDGETAAALVDSTTLAYFAGMIDAARTADSAEVARMEVTDRIMVLGLRMSFGKDRLMTLGPEEAMALSGTQALLGNERSKLLDIGDVRVDGDRASAPLRLAGLPVPARSRFKREHGGWKIDITSLFDLSRMAMEQMALRSGMSTNEWLMALLEDAHGTRPGNEIWHP